MSTSNWVPFTLPWDEAPIDLSPLYADERPAGRRGFVRTDGGRLVFEDGVEARFWGACLSAAANFPPHEDAGALARRMAKFGVNVCRLHLLDAEYSTPNIFQFNRTLPIVGTRRLDPRSMDRLDHLISCLKREGIYVYLDMLTYRRFQPDGDRVEEAAGRARGAGSYVYFDPRLIELQQEFNAQLWTHVNPYTGLAYADDPAIALMELLNEKDLFSSPPTGEPYRGRLEERYRAWADQHGIALDPAPVDFRALTAPMARFLGEVQQDYYRQMIAHLRSIGVKIPIAGTNMHVNLANLEAQAPTDFLDNHFYWNFPFWDEPSGTTTAPMVGSIRNCFANGVFHRVLDKPFFMSEWNHSWPDEWRAESPVALAAVAAFQGWSGATIYTYRYDTSGPVDRIGAASTPLGGTTIHQHLESFNDPALFGLFYHAALLFRRGDVRKGPVGAAIEVADDETGRWRLIEMVEEGTGPWHWKNGEIPAVQLIAERHRAGLRLPGQPTGPEVGSDPDQLVVDPAAGVVVSDTGELGRDWRKGYGWIDSPATKAVYGFVGRAGPIALDGLLLTIDTDFATVAVSSLTADPIARSTSLLLSAVGRCDNTGARYDATHRWQLDAGHGPIEIEAIEGELRLTTDQPRLRVWMLNERGDVVSWMPTTYEDGQLRFRIGLYRNAVGLFAQAENLAPFQWRPVSSMYYLIQA